MSVNNIPPTNRRLLGTTYLGSTVFGLEQAMKTMKIEAVPIRALKTAEQCEATVGKLISFLGRFRSAHAPRLKKGEVPEYCFGKDAKHVNQLHEGRSGPDVIGEQGVHVIADAIAQIVADSAHTA